MFSHNNETRFIYIPIETKQLNDYLNENIRTILETKIEDLKNKDSGLMFEGIKTMNVRLYKIKPLSAGIYVKLPLNNKSVLNIQNKDNKCFLWCVIAHFHPTSNHSTQTTYYKQYEKEINMTGIEYPVK